MTMVVLDNVTKRFRKNRDGAHDVVALDGVSLRLNEGEVLGVLGPSGCGKSTLLRLIAGLDQPDAGQVLYDGVPLENIPTQERGIGMVFQDGALMPHWAGWQTVGFFYWLRKREAEVPERVTQIARITGIDIERLLQKRPSQLSGGEKQRVGIARALARDPRVFLFDEPFSSLDAKIRAQARVELKRLLDHFPVTSVYVTHDQIEAIALADRIAVMRAGRIEQVGTYHDLYNNPANMFVAGFIGTPLMSEFAGQVIGGVWHSRLIPDFQFPVTLADVDRVTLGLRPEHFRLVTRGGLSAEVAAVTPFFAERYQLLEVQQGRANWRFTVPLEALVTVGQTIHCAPDITQALFFDGYTGVRLH